MATLADTLSRAFEIYYNRYLDSLNKNSRRNTDRIASTWNQINALYDIAISAVYEDNGTRSQEALDEIVTILNAEGIILSILPTPPVGIGLTASPTTISVPTDKDGNNPVYSSAYADVQITEGQAVRTTEWTYSIGVTSNVGASMTDNRVVISSLTADSGSVEVLCDRAGYSQLSVYVGVVRSKQGEDGTAAWSKNIDDLYYLDGNVGIGTNAPTSPLHILDSDIPEIIIECPISNLPKLRLKNSNSEYVLNCSDGYFVIKNDLTFDDVFIISNFGNVTIGDGVPVYKLDVRGDVNISSSSYYRINGTPVIGESSGLYSFGLVNSATDAKIIVTDANQIIFRRTDSLENARFDANGNLGIGTSSPAISALLDLESTTGGLLFPRMSTAQRNALTGVGGLVIFNLDTSKLQVYDGIIWNDLH